ncbi:MAG: HNH endonuclease [Thermoplasmataceae archaeon]
MLEHPALQESVFKDIPRLPEVRLMDVSGMFKIAKVEDFDPEGENKGKNIPWQTISRAVLLRDDYRCRVCGKGTFTQVDSADIYDKVHFDLEVHHIVPRKDGGIDSFRNLISLCSACHQKTFSNKYTGVPVRNSMDLFSFDKKIFLAVPPDEMTNFSRQVQKGILRDYQRIFDQENIRYMVVPMRGARLEFSAIRVSLEEYRKIVSGMLHSLEIADYSTYSVVISGNDEKCRFLTNSSGSIIA